MSPLDPHCGVSATVIPIHQKQRVIASVLACALTDEFSDEETLARFCSNYELDQAVIRRLSADLPRHSEQTLESYAGILGNQFRSFSSEVLAMRDVADLSSHLAQAYEELNLIYRVSTNLTVLKRPTAHFENLCEELVGSTVVDSFATILDAVDAVDGNGNGGADCELRRVVDDPISDCGLKDGPAAPSDQSAIGSLPSTASTTLRNPKSAITRPTVIRGGPLRVSDADLLRLYEQMKGARIHLGEVPGGPFRQGSSTTQMNPDPLRRSVNRSIVVQNNIRGDPAFAWAAEWLQQCVLFELSRNGKIFGGVLALNRVDRSDFCSQEIQLINAVVERSSAFLENVQLYDDLEQLFMGLLHALVSSIDAKDPYTCGHSQRVAWLSRHIANLTGLTDEKCQRVYLSGLLHDVGKIGISESVLRKTGRLTKEEFDEMKRHPEIGARILENIRQVQDLIPGVLHHHERLDGKGYPSRLCGDEVPFLGRVIGLADSLDAMTTSRTYRQARPVEIAAAEVRRCAGTQFDPLLVDLLLEEDLGTLLREATESAQQTVVRYPGLTAVAAVD